VTSADAISGTGVSRRRFLTWGVGGAAVVLAGATGVELVSHGMLPGKQTLDQLDGACDVAGPPLISSPVGPTRSGTFHSTARNRTLGYTVAYPPGHGPGSPLPLIVMLHGFGGDHTTAVAGMSPARALALHVDGLPLPPMAMVTVDGGGGYWNPHPGDDPLAMVVGELIPMCQNLGLGAGTQKIGAMGISMGGYGAIVLAEKYPGTFAAVAAISPALWTSYDQARGANAGAFASAGAFAEYDAIAHARSLAGKPVRVASGLADPFHPGVEAFARVLPTPGTVSFSGGCHTTPFFTSEEPPSLRFLGTHLAGSHPEA
jgi:pimeloyl-ACP methyl ester carboxylesterase